MTAVRAIYTLMPDYGGAFDWVHTADPTSDYTYLGGGPQITEVWDEVDRMYETLEGALQSWQGDFERADLLNEESAAAFDWARFHSDGLALARRVRAMLVPQFRVVYEKPYEDPDCAIDERREVMPDGGLRALPSRADVNRHRGPPDEGEALLAALRGDGSSD